METEVQENSAENEVVEPILDIGEALKSKRIELGLDERAVATQLKLPIEQIRALETNNFDYFRSRTFARGFLKNYVRLIELNEAEIIEAFDKITKPEEATPVIEPINKSGKQLQMADPIVIIVSVIIVVLLIFLAFWWPTIKQSAAPSLPEDDTEPAAEVTPAENEDLSLEEIAKRALQTEIQADSSKSEEGTSSSSEEVVTGLSAETKAILKDAGVDPDKIKVPEKEEPVVEAQPEVVQTQQQATDDVVHEDVPLYTYDLVINYVIDCWTEVRDSKGEILFSGIKTAGSSLELTEDGTYNIVLGYAPGVGSVVFKGKTVDLAPYTRQNLVRVELK